jgi:hypothetical protein
MPSVSEGTCPTRHGGSILGLHGAGRNGRREGGHLRPCDVDGIGTFGSQEEKGLLWTDCGGYPSNRSYNKLQTSIAFLGWHIDKPAIETLASRLYSQWTKLQLKSAN